MEINNGRERNGREKKSLSDSILHSYRHTQSSNTSHAFPAAISAHSFISRSNSRTILSNNSEWGDRGSNASFNLTQRSAAVKEDVILCISKMNEGLKMIEQMQLSDHANGHTDALQQQQQQNYNPNQDVTQGTSQNFFEFCASQIKQNISKIALYVEDDYYRIITGNMNGIETIIRIMNTFSSYEEQLSATCNLTLGILCQRSPLYQSKLLEAYGILSIVASIENFPTSESVCSTAVDALVHITTNNAQAMIQLRQIQSIGFMLHSIDNCLYPLSRLNRDILLNHL